MNVGIRFSWVSQRTIRLVTNANHKPPVLEPLAPSFGARSKLEALEGVTSGRLIAESEGIPGLPAEDLAATYGQTYINAALAYPRPKGNRFNPDEWCAWYSGFVLDTSMQEMTFHLTRALTAAGGEYDNTTYCIELRANFDEEFCDLRDIIPAPDCLHADTGIGYAAGQELARKLREGGRNSVVYPSVRHSGGTCLVAFWPHLVQNFQQGDTWKLTWAGSSTPSITRVESRKST